MSIAWVEEDNPDTVYLMTNGNNPLVIGRTTDGDVVWASTKSILQDSDFVMSDVFHAVPFKLYSVGPDGLIRSRYISDQRADPDVGWQIHASQRTYRGEWGFGTTAPKRKARKARKSSKQAKAVKAGVSKLLVQGWIVDEDGNWRYVK
jgi:hypothetical protein